MSVTLTKFRGFHCPSRDDHLACRPWLGASIQDYDGDLHVSETLVRLEAATPYIGGWSPAPSHGVALSSVARLFSTFFRVTRATERNFSVSQVLAWVASRSPFKHWRSFSKVFTFSRASIPHARPRKVSQSPQCVHQHLERSGIYLLGKREAKDTSAKLLGISLVHPHFVFGGSVMLTAPPTGYP
ncbi:hypothetical protein BHM03_00016607 [Ensete ventricosum]|nr:hypothetical protein BHM03_00016607 [Ensete ventricosum]